MKDIDYFEGVIDTMLDALWRTRVPNMAKEVSDQVKSTIEAGLRDYIEQCVTKTLRPLRHEEEVYNHDAP